MGASYPGIPRKNQGLIKDFLPQADSIILGGLAWHYRERPELLLVLTAIGASFLLSDAMARAEGLDVEYYIGLME